MCLLCNCRDFNLIRDYFLLREVKSLLNSLLLEPVLAILGGYPCEIYIKVPHLVS